MTWRIPRTLCLAALCACAGGGKDAGVDLTKPVTGAEASNAAIAYNKALQEKKSENFIEATRLFEYVRTNFPYSQYSAMAELGVADMSFDREDWGAAATQFQDFVKSHPSHPKADYAAYRAGMAYFQDRPSDFFLLPPSYEKDQGPVRQALEALNRFVNGYPKSEYIPKAKALISDCRELLAAHERYVAEFYVKNEQWKGAAQRYMTLADTYGDLRDGTMHGESLWNAANAWQKANDPGDERADPARTGAANAGHRDAAIAPGTAAAQARAHSSGRLIVVRSCQCCGLGPPPGSGPSPEPPANAPWGEHGRPTEGAGRPRQRALPAR